MINVGNEPKSHFNKCITILLYAHNYLHTLQVKPQFKSLEFFALILLLFSCWVVISRAFLCDISMTYPHKGHQIRVG